MRTDMTAEREALLVRAGYVEARRQRALEQDDLDAHRHCEQELAMLRELWARIGVALLVE